MKKFIFEIRDYEINISNINELNPLKRSKLNRFNEYLISNLSVITQKIIRNISLIGNIEEILKVIYNPKFFSKKSKTISYGAVNELKSYKKKITNFLLLIRSWQDEELNKEYAKLIITSTFKDLPINFTSKFETIFDAMGKIKLFRLLSLLIESDLLFNKNEKKVFLKTCSNSKGTQVTLVSIATELNLSRERIRQLKPLLKKKIQNYFFFNTNFVIDDFVNYEIETERPFKVIDDSFTDKINQREEVNFNKQFYLIILGLLLKKSKSTLGEDKTLNGKKKTINGKLFNCCYLINRNLSNVFKFELLIDDINSRLLQRISETYTLHFKGYILQYLNEKNKHLIKEIIPILETIILNEFELIVNSDNNLVFERNTFIQLRDFVFEILEANGNKMKIKEICNAIKLKYPELEITEPSIRSTILREKKLFIFFGRNSTYGLKKWEVEKENLKGGTIRDIVEKLLLHSNTPKHISEINNYIKNYRNTNAFKIMSNIKLESKNRFQIFEGGYIGLPGKIYGIQDLHYKRVLGCYFSKKMLAKLNGFEFEKVVEHYVRKYGYTPVQVRFILEKKMVDGFIQITPDNKLKV